MGKIMLILRENMPQNTIITIDAGNFSGWIQRFWKYTKAKTQLAPTSGAMGYSIPAAISAKISQKNTPVIAFCGDGGFMMSSQELATCNQYKIKPIYKTFPGWKSKTQGVRNMKDLPENAKKYIYALEDFIGAKISSVSTSPERDDTILIEDPFKY